MMFSLKGVIITILMYITAGLVITGLFWVFNGVMTSKNIALISIAIVVLSPRFEVISSQSGKSLQMTGISVMLFHSIKNLSKRRRL